jgi:signal peptidase I
VRNPIDRVTERIPPQWRTAIDWLLTIAIAVAAVLAIKAWVVNPYRIPSSSMEPTLHCAHSEVDTECEARFSDRVLANRFIYHFTDPSRGDIIVFKTPPKAKTACGIGSDTFVKRLIGLPGERFSMRDGVVYINRKPLDEPYLPAGARDDDTRKERVIPEGHYFMMGDNRNSSCDSREWGTVPRDNIIGKVFGIYWPPQRIGIR